MNRKKCITIVDHGLGNLHSISSAIKYVGADVILTRNIKEIEKADALLLPGVGAFRKGMENLKQYDLVDSIKKHSDQDKPLLGICLGMQMLFEKSYEFGEYDGLKIIEGAVEKLIETETEKVPHVTWNHIHTNEKSNWENTILENVEIDSDVYFVHSYAVKPLKDDVILSKTLYGAQEFCSSVKKGNTYGCQFHPEKSGEIGLEILKKFIYI